MFSMVSVKSFRNNSFLINSFPLKLKKKGKKKNIVRAINSNIKYTLLGNKDRLINLIIASRKGPGISNLLEVPKK